MRRFPTFAAPGFLCKNFFPTSAATNFLSFQIKLFRFLVLRYQSNQRKRFLVRGNISPHEWNSCPLNRFSQRSKSHSSQCRIASKIR